MAKLLARIVKLLTPKRCWAQFSLATMFVVVTALCVGCAWLAVQVQRANKQRKAMDAIKSIGGGVHYYETASDPFPRPFLRRWLAQDYFDEVLLVDFRFAKVTDAELAHLQGLTGLKLLSLSGTQVTDVGLAHLQGLTRLEKLWLGHTNVTDAGLAQLQGLTRLKMLDLNGTQVTDAAFAHLHGLTGLQQLALAGTRVTDSGLAHLQGLARLEFLDLGDTQVTDAGLVHLQGLTGLQELRLYRTQVTDAGLAQLGRALPKCRMPDRIGTISTNPKPAQP